jgi:hypothetical protein
MSQKTKSIYITVRLDVEYDENLMADEVESIVNDVVSEMEYEMKYKSDVAEIIDTEICGINE